MFELFITGDNIHKIPVKLPRKQIPYQIRMKNCGAHKIEIKSIGRGAFCGWNIDKNERFLLGDFTITHNTRLSGGKDSASERYIFTQLNPITRLIYRAEDDAVLEYLDDDGQLVEPTFYAPIVPMVLVNGTKGIGTGFSTDIMCHNPLQIIDYIGNMLLQKPEAEWGPIEPYYRGFKGTITPLAAPGKFLIRGIHTVDAAKKQVRVTELPVGYWTEDFKKHLESLIETGAIKDYVDMSTDTVVDFTVTFPATADLAGPAFMAIVDHGCCTAIEKLLKLYTTESTSNMHLFDSQDQLKKYGNVRDIVRDYYATRLKLYNERKTHQLAAMAAELLLLSNKARYIQELLDGSIDLRRKRGDELTAMMQSKGYDHMEGDEQYKYLLKLPMDSVSEENVQKLLKEKGQKEAQHAALQGTGIEQLWLADLAELRAEYVKQEEKRVSAASTTGSASTGTGAKKIVKVKK
jgi:DNA topoisomerase-2